MSNSLDVSMADRIRGSAAHPVSRESFFTMIDYKQLFLKELLGLRPKKGILSRISARYRIPNSTLSQVFHGDRHLTPEQAVDIAEFLKFSSLETDYFVLLVELQRAGTERLRKRIRSKIEELRLEQLKAKRIFADWTKLNESDKFEFYSNWDYSAVHLCLGLAQSSSAERISQRLGLSHQRVNHILNFLCRTGMALETNRLYSIGSRGSILPAEDPLVSRHHRNWRLMALTRMERGEALAADEFSLTIPFVGSEQCLQELRSELMKFIEGAKTKIEASECEEIFFLNLDLGRVGEQGPPK